MSRTEVQSGCNIRNFDDYIDDNRGKEGEPM